VACWPRTPTGSRCRLAPPLVVEADELDWAVDQLAEVLAARRS
jgi:acetylornithine/succinyldiaminopimelate/putrescine aminotransferase